MSLNPKVKVFDPSALTVQWGHIIFGGWGPDDAVIIDPESDDTEDESGVDGEVTVIMLNDTRCTITCNMAQMSDTNAQISAVRNIGLRTRMIGAILKMSIVDLNGDTVFEADNVWVKKAPQRTFGRRPNQVGWEFRVAHSIRTDGGAPTIGF
jgi:hypothetical protein